MQGHAHATKHEKQTRGKIKKAHRSYVWDHFTKVTPS